MVKHRDCSATGTRAKRSRALIDSPSAIECVKDARELRRRYAA